MKTASAILVLCAVIYLSAGRQQGGGKASAEVKTWAMSELQQLYSYLDSASRPEADTGSLKRFYHLSRKHYKHCEFLLEHNFGGVVKYFLNGPAIPRYDPANPDFMTPPRGFQQAEALLFGDSVPDLPALRQELVQMRNKVRDIQDFVTEMELEEGKLLEMVQLEFYRMVSLNLSGYDATVTLTNVREAVWSLEGIEKVIHAFRFYLGKGEQAHADFTRLQKRLAQAKTFLLASPRFEDLNRLAFITGHVNEINRLVVKLHKHLDLPWTEQTALNLSSGDLFTRKGINTDFFALDYTDSLNRRLQAGLGKILFFDPLLSHNNRRSCASCHNPDKGFTDGIPKSRSSDSSVFLTRNAPTLLNVIFQRAFFYDGRALQMEQQAFDVIHNRQELGESLDKAVEKLKGSREYRQLFSRAFVHSADSEITPYGVQKALTEYERTLISLNSRFDRFLNGDRKALTASEINGFNLFAGKALCGSCHFFPLFNGTVPPFYNDSEFEVIGVPATAENKELDKDPGRVAVIAFEELRHSFKTPTVRNAWLTGPYMHNGVYRDLEQVVDFYQKGGGAGLGFDVPNQTLPPDTLSLTAQEKKDIIAFMKCLTDTSGLTSKPLKLPGFEKGSPLNKRRTGGEY